jgi:hypothetical protein
MTISPNPRVFDFSRAIPVGGMPGAGEPELQRIFWHGTCVKNVDEILKDGIIPEKTQIGHTCLTTNPAMALLFARLTQAFSPELDGVEPVLIRIDGAQLHPDALCPETGMVECGAYGKHIEGRSKKELTPLKGDWQRLLEATEAVGYTKVIPVDAAMVDYRPQTLPALTFNGIIKEMDIGFPQQMETIHLLDEITRELAPAIAA